MGWQDAPTVPQPAWASAPVVDTKQPSTLKEDVVGELESTGHLLSGAGAGLAGGINFLASLAAGRGTEDALRRKQMTENALTYQPRTQAGKEITANLERPFQKLAEKGAQAGEATLRATKSPLLAAGARTVVEGAPSLLPGVPKSLRAVGREISPLVRPVAERVAQAGEASTAVRAAEQAPKNIAIEQARKVGIKLPPSEVARAPIGKVLEGASGKVQTEKALSRDNAKIVNRLAAKEIGLSERQPMTEANIARQKQKAFKVYDRVRNAGRIAMDDQYRAELNAVKELTAQEATDFPEDTNELIDKEIKKFDVPGASSASMLSKIKSLRERAGKNMQATDAEKFELGIAQKKIATAMENLIERQVSDQGLVGEFRQARTQLAKIYNVEEALGPSGNLTPAILARQLKRGVPLSGGLKDIAELYQEFPQVLRSVDGLGGHTAFSALDYLVGGVEIAANPRKGAAIVGALAGRPLARGIIKSRPYQRAAIKPGEPRPSLTTQAARKLAGPQRLTLENFE